MERTETGGPPFQAQLKTQFISTGITQILRQLAAIHMHPEDIRIIEYNYPLPEGQIAKYPLSERDASRLLVYENGSIREDVYKHLADYLPSGSRMFFNNSKVVEARIIFQKLTGAFIELFCLEPHEQY